MTVDELLDEALALMEQDRAAFAVPIPEPVERDEPPTDEEALEEALARQDAVTKNEAASMVARAQDAVRAARLYYGSARAQ